MFCRFCGKEYQLPELPPKQWEDYFEGSPAYIAFPDISVNLRTQIVFNLCLDCVRELAGEEQFEVGKTATRLPDDGE